MAKNEQHSINIQDEDIVKNSLSLIFSNLDKVFFEPMFLKNIIKSNGVTVKDIIFKINSTNTSKYSDFFSDTRFLNDFFDLFDDTEKTLQDLFSNNIFENFIHKINLHSRFHLIDKYNIDLSTTSFSFIFTLDDFKSESLFVRYLNLFQKNNLHLDNINNYFFDFFFRLDSNRDISNGLEVIKKINYLNDNYIFNSPDQLSVFIKLHSRLCRYPYKNPIQLFSEDTFFKQTKDGFFPWFYAIFDDAFDMNKHFYEFEKKVPDDIRFNVKSIWHYWLENESYQETLNRNTSIMNNKKLVSERIQFLDGIHHDKNLLHTLIDKAANNRSYNIFSALYLTYLDKPSLYLEQAQRTDSNGINFYSYLPILFNYFSLEYNDVDDALNNESLFDLFINITLSTYHLLDLDSDIKVLGPDFEIVKTEKLKALIESLNIQKFSPSLSELIKSFNINQHLIQNIPSNNITQKRKI